MACLAGARAIVAAPMVGVAMLAANTLGLLAPAGTPKPIIDRLNGELKKILSAPDVREAMLKAGVFAAYTTPADTAVALRDEVAKWTKVASEGNIKGE
jgi:tripartite-type tricarboxylate transporter receptor subunit TctC